jgi:hypothetical protein
MPGQAVVGRARRVLGPRGPAGAAGFTNVGAAGAAQRAAFARALTRGARGR